MSIRSNTNQTKKDHFGFKSDLYFEAPLLGLTLFETLSLPAMHELYSDAESGSSILSFWDCG